MKYIVLWFLVSYVPGSAPVQQPDEYTGQISYQQNLVMHYDKKEELKYKIFDTEKEAADFMSKAPVNIKAGMKIVTLKSIEQSMFKENNWGIYIEDPNNPSKSMKGMK